MHFSTQGAITMNDGSTIYGQAAPDISERYSSNRLGQICVSYSSTEANAAVDPNKVSDLTANFVANIQAKYLQLKKRDIA